MIYIDRIGLLIEIKNGENSYNLTIKGEEYQLDV
jgi:hypothetical protein